MNTTIGKAINNGIDIGIRCLLPNYIEDEIIDLKNNLLKYGLKDGITKSVESVIDTGKSALGIVTGKFENISQIQNVLKRGGILDSISELLDNVFEKIRYNGNVNYKIMDLIENGKDAILDSVEMNIEKTLDRKIEEIQLSQKLNLVSW